MGLEIYDCYTDLHLVQEKIVSLQLINDLLALLNLEILDHQTSLLADYFKFIFF